MTKNADPDKWFYSKDDTGFDACGSFSLSHGSRFGKNVIIFGCDMSSLLHIDNKKNIISSLSKGLTGDLDDTKLTAEKEYSINLTLQQNKFCVGLIIMVWIVIYLLTVLISKQKICK